MLEPFQSYCAERACEALSIDSSTFEASLTGRDGKIFHSIGCRPERRLLTASMLWGLAQLRRPIPTIIDTHWAGLTQNIESPHRTIFKRFTPGAPAVDRRGDIQ